MNKEKDKKQNTQEEENYEEEKPTQPEEEIEISEGENVTDEKDETEENTETESKEKDEQNKTEEQLQEVIQENEELNEKIQRLAAEFENYKKRTKKREKERLKYDGKNVLKKLLPVFDDIDRAVQHKKETKDSNSEDQNSNNDNGGIEMIHKKLHNILEDLEVVKYDSEGEKFDPDRHHAIMTREEEDQEPDTVVEEIEKGYRYKDKILRYAKVIVSK